ncbi:MAG: c-type cytochrome biogenesis protein CcsB [Actinocatenispora sp.]
MLAMVGYAVEYAFGHQGAVARIAARAPRRQAAPQTVKVLATAGGGDDVLVEDATVDATAEPHRPVSADRAAAIGRIALGVQTLAAVAHAACLVCRALAAHRVPWGNMYEYVLMACLIATVAWLVVAYRRPTVRHLGLFVTLVVAILLCIDAAKLYTTAGPLVPALNSYWLWIHVSAMTLASGIFMVGFVAVALYLIQERREAWLADDQPLRFPLTLGDRLPAAETLERLGFRIHALAFPIWTFGIMCGAIWAEHAWGRYWGWDPKETWSFISWVVYAAYLHARATPSIRGRWSSWIAIVGWATMLVNLFGVNLVVQGLHSYAGVS